jgi:hypothetical protein
MKLYIVKTLVLEYDDIGYKLSEGIDPDTLIFINKNKATATALNILHTKKDEVFNEFKKDYICNYGFDENKATKEAKIRVLSLVFIDVYEMQEDVDTSQLIKLETITFEDTTELNVWKQCE